MAIAFISDLHLTPEAPRSTLLFEQFIANACHYITQLYILGDLFEYWIGDDGGEVLGHQKVEAALRKTVDAGTEIFFLPGNRDFLIGEAFAERTGCRLMPDPVVIQPDGIRILLTHGDALCTDDTSHQAARHQMLSGKWKRMFLEQPLHQRMQTAFTMRQESEQNKGSNPPEIMDVNQSAVEEMMRKHDVHIMIHGHTHQPAAHAFRLDGQLRRRYVLGDWYDRKSVIYFEQGHLTLRR